ncbi:K02A2.6-like [Cordylochernes scorpioides]|uniref:RNA-directed DNA polymerase n=1 Tax=Cordylochernes scorpioides TaxID=51811 RepID=A0ABY6KXW7_9ARAC|nr:K02A2.6-like [Cordylochernes scorpioides]
MQIAAPEGFNFGKPNEWPIWFKRFQRYRIASGLSEKSENEQRTATRYLKRRDDQGSVSSWSENFNLSEKLQLESELTLEKAIQIVRQSESVKNQQKEIRQDTENRNVDAIDKKGGRNGTIFQKTRMKGTKTYDSNFPKNHQGWSSNEKRKCFRCGYYQGHSKEQCPAKDAICNKFRKKGHFAKVVTLKPYKNDKVNDQPIKFKIDTGAEVSVMPEEIYLQHFGYLKTEKADKNLFAVSKKIEVNGMFQAFLESKRQKCEESIYIVKGVARPLLSCRASEILGLVRRINIVEDHAPTKLDPMLKFPKLFTGLGKIDIPYEIKSVEELKQFLGMVNFSARFVPNLAEISHPLNKLLSKKEEWIWEDDQDRAFDKIKKSLTSAQGLALRSNWQTKDGLRQVIAYASRTLSEAEKRYAQIEKEALAITWACEKFKQYIQGLVITLETDHKPLVPIFTSKNIDDLTPRIQRLRLRIMRYSYKIVHTPGKNLIVADALSRSPRMKVGTQELEEELCAYVQQVVSFMPISDVRVEEIKERSRYVIPENIRKGLLQRIHEGHLGIVKCRGRAKGSVWKEQIDISHCYPSELPSCPWEKVGVDLFTLKGQNYLLITDYYSRYPEIARLEDMTSASVIVHCKSIFARHGIPLEVRSDNGPQFGSLFKEFAQDYGFTHVTSSPRYRQSNGFIESFVKIVKERIGKSKDPYLALLAYRATPLANGFSPAELSMGRRIRTTIPTPTKQHQPPNLKNLKNQEAIQREKTKILL